MRMRLPDHVHLLNAQVGKKIAAIFLRVYEYEQRLDWADTPLQIVFADEVTIQLRSASDGETLAVEEGPWQDPFQGKLTPENQQYLEEHGRWTLQDVSGTEPFNRLIGTELKEVHQLLNEYHKLCGAQFIADAVVLNFYVDGDECLISWGADNEDLIQCNISVQ
jgi:alkylated DNA repair dioxygenase AlkB